MARNGSGTYALPAGNPVVTGTTVSSTWANNTLSDIATALTGSVARDGQAAMTGPLDMGTENIINAGNITASGTISGDGSALTDLNGTEVTSGTVADTRLSSNVPLKNAANAFSANQFAPQWRSADASGHEAFFGSDHSIGGYIGTDTHKFVFYTGNVARGNIGASGGYVVGAPAGDDKGAGTINVEAAYQGGVALLSSGTFTATIPGASNANGTISYEVDGTRVTLKCVSGINGTGSTTGFTITGIPAGIQPALGHDSALLFPYVVNNSLATQATAVVETGGSITFYAWSGLTGVSSSGFTAANNKGLPAGWVGIYSLL